MTAIKSFDYLEQYEALRDEIHRGIDRVLASGRLILGREVEAFEAEFSRFLGVRGAVGVANGTDALVIGLRALGVGAGDEVVTVANTAVPTVSAIRELGAVPVFCDVDPSTGLMDLEQVDRCLGEKTKVVVPVHLYGNMVDVQRLRDALGARPIRILEDCAQAHGATLRGEMAGSFGDVSAFSFYPTKNLGAMGDAGLCASDDPALLDLMRSLRQYGYEGGQRAVRDGRNSRLDELQAAILRAKLPHLPGFVARRRELAARYDAILPEEARRFAVSNGVEHAYHLYVVRVAKRDDVRKRLADDEIGTGIHYADPIHLMDAYADLGHQSGSLPHTEELADQVLSLPLYPELPLAAVERVAARLARHMEASES